MLSHSVVSDSLRPMDCSLPGSSVHGNSPGRNTGVGCHFLLQWNLPDPGIEPRSPIMQADALTSEPPGKPKNTGVDSLSLLQGNFPTQESNWDFLHCRRILYQLSYPGNPERLCTALQWRPLIYIRTKAAIRFFDPWYNPVFCLLWCL